MDNPINHVDPTGERCLGMFMLHAPVIMSFGVGMRSKGFAIEYIPPSNIGLKPDDIKLVQVIDTANVPYSDGGGSSGTHGPHIDVYENGRTPTTALVPATVVDRYYWGHDPFGTHTVGDFWKWKLPGYLDGIIGSGTMGVPVGWNSTAYSDLPGADKTTDYNFPIETAAVVKATGEILGAVQFTFYSGTGTVDVPGASWSKSGDQLIVAAPPRKRFLDGQSEWYNYEGKHP